MRPEQALDALEGLQNPDGGWGAVRGAPSNTESTALALLALHAGRGPAREVERGLAWLEARQRPDGAWPFSDQVPRSSWTTSLAVLALTEVGQSDTRAREGAAWLLGQEGRGFPWYTKVLQRLFPSLRVIELDSDLRGWPWVEDTFSWIEPTAYALLALKRLRAELPWEALAPRISEGERMILDRACRDGGWNYGNSRVFGEDLWPYPDTTALALIALQDLPRDGAIEAGLDALGRMLRRNDSLLALALSIQCLRIYGLEAAELRTRLGARLDRPEVARETRSTALAILALLDTSSPFALPVHAS